MMHSDEIDKICPAMVNFQAGLNNISKSKQGYGYKYADLPSVFDEIKPLLKENGLFILQPVGEEDGYLTIGSYIFHTSGQFFGDKIKVHVDASNKKMNESQSMGSTITYMRRYGLASLLGIAMEDDDGRSSTAKAPRPKTTNEDSDKTTENNRIYADINNLIRDHQIDGAIVIELLQKVGVAKLKDLTTDQAVRLYKHLEKNHITKTQE